MADRFVRLLARFILRVSDAVEQEREAAPIRAKREAAATAVVTYIEGYRAHG